VLPQDSLSDVLERILLRLLGFSFDFLARFWKDMTSVLSFLLAPYFSVFNSMLSALCAGLLPPAADVFIA